MKFVAIAASSVAASLAIAILCSWYAGQARPEIVTVFLLRHAEAVDSESPDRELTAAGAARARTLARLLSQSGATHLYSSPYPRSRMTIAPLAQALGLAVHDIAADDRAGYIATLRQLPPGSVAVVAGHSNTIPGLVRALGGEISDLVDHPRYGPMLHHDSYDRIFVVTLPAGEGAAIQTVELRYGE